MAFDTWDSYIYPETYDPETATATLRNLYDIRDAAVLKRREYTATARRGAELSAGLASVNRTYDAAHLRALHRYLFQDVYAWAGEYRSVDITKGRTDFANVDDGSIDRRLRGVHESVEAVDWSTLDRVAFVENTSAVFAELNTAHPFREGNGRSSKMFMEHVAERSPFELSWEAVPPAVWNQRSELSGPDPATPWSPPGWDTHPEELHGVFNAMTADRAVVPKAELSAELSALRASLDTSSPRPAHDATRQLSADRPEGGRPRVGYDGRGNTGRAR